MNKLLLPLVFSGLAMASFGAYAAEESTITAGFAQSRVSAYGEKLDEKPRGFNIKYRYEFDDKLGVISSFTHTSRSYDVYAGSEKIANADLSYYSLTAGPVYRFNDYISGYGMLGWGYGKAKIDASYAGYRASENLSENSFAYGAGLQFNVTKNIAIDAHYEYAKLGETKVGTWTLGAGYRF